MKQFSLVLNILLLIAVGFLYFLHFSTNKKEKEASNTANYYIKDTSSGKRMVIAYVELDSLNNNVAFIKRRKKELEAEQRIIANEYESAYREMEAEKNNFLKKGKAITQPEVEAFQNKLGQKQRDVEDIKQVKSQKLAEKGARIMEDMQSKLKDFMNEYNKQKGYTYILATGTGLDYLFFKDSTLNITSDIVKGLNQKMGTSRKE